ncbi:MAG TPA: hypothetical protein PK425_09210 [Syntrophales bacterium]|nr:hypothetical protein [Syntrophales bacterium]
MYSASIGFAVGIFIPEIGVICPGMGVFSVLGADYGEKAPKVIGFRKTPQHFQNFGQEKTRYF